MSFRTTAWQEGYDEGHIDGESSCAAAWCTALSEVLPNGFDLTPSTVAAEIARLRGALTSFGRHCETCPMSFPVLREHIAAVCTCGFDAALRGEEGTWPSRSP